MHDTIYRQDAINAIEHITSNMSVCMNLDECHGMKRIQRQAVIELANLPSAQQKPVKFYNIGSICCYCLTTDCAGCFYEPMTEENSDV